jgi:hypothetical protein
MPTTLVVAGMAAELSRLGRLNADRFTLNKSRSASQHFVNLLRSADLFVGIDAGPLHLAAALGVPSIAIFGPTAPETILDRDSRVVPFRHVSMRGIFCDILRCTDPQCLYQISDQLDFDAPTTTVKARLHLENEHCAMLVGYEPRAARPESANR